MIREKIIRWLGGVPSNKTIGIYVNVFDAAGQKILSGYMDYSEMEVENKGDIYYLKNGDTLSLTAECTTILWRRKWT